MSAIIGRGRYARATYPVAPSSALSTDEKVKVTAADPTPGFLAAKMAAGTNVVLTVLPGQQLEVAVPLAGLYPVPDNVFSINDDFDPTKFLNVELAGQTTGTTQTIVTTATISRPFRLPDISGTAVVQEDVTGKVYMGIGVTGDAVNSNAGIQYSTLTANRAQLRVNQFGANSAGPGATGFKSRGLVIGQFPGTPAAFVGCIGGDILYRITAIGVAANNQDIPLAGTVTIQVPPGFVSAPPNNYLPTEFEVALVPLAGPINSRRAVQLVTSEGETQTLRGLRAGGPATLPAALGAGTLWSSGTGTPEGVITGSPGDLWSRTDGGSSTTLYVKESGVATNTGWIPVQSAGVARNVLFWGAGTLALTAVTRFLRPGYQSGLAPTTSVRMPITRAGTLQRLFVRCRVAGAGVNNITYTVLLNGVATTLAVSMLPTSVSASNVVDTVVVVAGDFVELQVTKAGVIITTPTDVEVAFEEAA